jgi:protocatechuate 3,4-dioxygenase beta subunit
MKALEESNLIEEVIARLGDTPNPRLKEILTSLVRHLHTFVRDVQLTPEEWWEGIQFLTACGQFTSDKRQEFVLLSDAHGVSALVNLLARANDPTNVTHTCLLGPFYRENSTYRELGDTIAAAPGGDCIIVRGHVLDRDGKPVERALLEVWHCSPAGFYDAQDPTQPDMNQRGRFRTNTGYFVFRTTRPRYYPVPTDGPVGKLVLASGRQPYRPAHVHFVITAPGYERLVTALYIKGDRYIDGDVLFESDESLVAEYKKNECPGEPDILERDFVLAEAKVPVHIQMAGPKRAAKDTLPNRSRKD